MFRDHVSEKYISLNPEVTQSVRDAFTRGEAVAEAADPRLPLQRPVLVQCKAGESRTIFSSFIPFLFLSICA